MGLALKIIQKLQVVQNAAVGIVTDTLHFTQVDSVGCIGCW